MNFLLLTAHDYRTPRKANMHFIAEQLATRGTMRFFSLRYSALSKRKNDARAFLDDRANRVERVDGVDCYLWKQPIHPFNTHRTWLQPLESAWFGYVAEHVPSILRQWIREADVIFFESGSAILHVALAKRLNPSARLVYIASDDLDTIGVAEAVKTRFAVVAPLFDALCVPSPRLAMPPGARRYFVPHGLEPSLATRGDPSPYPPGSRVAVSVGSMLFDPTFFRLAAPAFRDLTFHVIGSGLADPQGFAANVRFHGEMDHDETLRYIKHAAIGIAPYRADAVPAYLVETSMKLMQYAFFGVPAVCPASVTGDLPYRHGYQPGCAASIAAAIRGALAAPAFAPPRFLDWSQVTDRLIDPAAFDDTRLAA